MNNGSFAKYTTAYINRPSNSQLADIKIEIERLLRIIKGDNNFSTNF